MKADVLKIFREICSVPHGSGNTKPVSDLVKGIAESNGLSVIQDEFNNLVIKKPAGPGYENHETVVLQGHLDMVAVKTDDSPKNLATDGLDVADDGEFMWAENTSLGGDDGIAIATAMAVLLDKTLAHPPLEALFTVDEETNMIGAQKFDPSLITGRTLINIDSEKEGEFIVSCAGGTRCEFSAEICAEDVTDDIDFWKFEINGLTGGHSGAEIHHGRANANKLMFEILSSFPSVRIAEINGGTFENVIPKSCCCIAAVNGEVYGQISRLCKTFKEKYAKTDPFMTFSIEKTNSARVLSEDASMRLIQLGKNLPDGVVKFSEKLPGFVETSLNLGVVRISEKGAKMITAIRSSIPSEKQRVFNEVCKIAESFDISAEKKHEYPEWEYKEESKLRDISALCYKNLFGKSPVIAGVHAGLECGVLSKKLPGLDAISIGPNIYDIHSVNEKLDIKSTERLYDFLVLLLENL